MKTNFVIAMSVFAYLAYTMPFKELMITAIGLAVIACCLEGYAHIIRS